MRGALCVATRLYILYLAADESISGWEFLLLIPKSPQGNAERVPCAWVFIIYFYISLRVLITSECQHFVGEHIFMVDMFSPPKFNVK